MNDFSVDIVSGSWAFCSIGTEVFNLAVSGVWFSSKRIEQLSKFFFTFCGNFDVVTHLLNHVGVLVMVEYLVLELVVWIFFLVICALALYWSDFSFWKFYCLLFDVRFCLVREWFHLRNE